MVCKLIGCNLCTNCGEKLIAQEKRKNPDQKASNDVADWKWEKKRA